MTNKIMKASDGKYHIKGKAYELLEGSRTQVNNGTAYRTTGGLTKDDILMNKNGYLVSKKKHITATKEKRLIKYGFVTRKGKFGNIKQGKKNKKLTLKQRKSLLSKSQHKEIKHNKSKKMKGGLSDNEVDNICNSGEINCIGLSFEDRKRKAEEFAYEKEQMQKTLEYAKKTKPSAYGDESNEDDIELDFSKLTINKPIAEAPTSQVPTSQVPTSQAPTSQASTYRYKANWVPVEQKKQTGWSSKKFGYNK